MKVTARAQRSDGWWAIEVPEVPGLHTQTRRLDQVEAMVRDAVALMEDVSESDVEVDVMPELDEQVAALLSAAKAARVQADELSDKAASGIRDAARTLASSGMSLRDVGVVLGVSHQRVAQLLDPVGPRTIKEHAEAGARAYEQRSAGMDKSTGRKARSRSETSASVTVSAKDGHIVTGSANGRSRAKAK